MTIIKKFSAKGRPASGWEPEERKSAYPKKYGALIIITLFILVIIEIWASNTMVTYGEKFESLFKLSKTLQMENQILENEIANNTSLISIASKSAQLGFLKPESIQYIR